MRFANARFSLLTVAILLHVAARLPAQPVPIAQRSHRVLASDTALAKIYLVRDLNNNGHANDPGEVSVYFDETNASGLAAPTGQVLTIFQSVSGHVFFGNNDTDTVYLLIDLNGDGDALDAGEATVWFSAAGNAGGFAMPTPNGISQDASGATYIVNAGVTANPADVVFRTVDLNNDGDAEDAGEATIWFNLQMANPLSSAFDIAFIFNTAYISDLVGGDPDVIWRANDANGSGSIDPGEFNVFIADGNPFGVPVAIGLAADCQSVYVVENSSTAAQTVFRLTDINHSLTIDAANEVQQVWNEPLSLPPIVIGAVNGIAVGPNREVMFTSSGAVSADNLVRLADANGDGDALDLGEASVFKDGGGADGVFIDTVRAVQYLLQPSQETFVEAFDNNANTGNWSYFGDPNNPIEVIETTGGNPDAYLHSTCNMLDCLDTFAPQPRTQLGVQSIYTGNYRARGVTGLGIDLILFDVDFGAGGRPLSVILRNDNGTPENPLDDRVVHHVGTAEVPEVGEGWQSFDFAIPSQSLTLPAGWVNQQPSGAGNNADWNAVITDVDQVSFFYGDPDNFFIFQQWEPGLDNPRITYALSSKGDLNCDGVTDFDDVAPFVTVLLDPAAYIAAFPCCDMSRADVNMDGQNNGLDVNGFSQCVLGMCP